MRIAILSSEVVPFAKTGGLADVAGALPKALSRQDVDARIILPLHEQIDRKLLNNSVIKIEVPWRGGRRETNVFYSNAAGAPAYLIESPEYFSHGSIYGQANDHERYTFFSRAALTLLQTLNWAPEVVHANDWPCGFAMVDVRTLRRHDELFSHTRSLFSIHNLAYQGVFDPEDLWWLGLASPPTRMISC